MGGGEYGFCPPQFVEGEREVCGGVGVFPDEFGRDDLGVRQGKGGGGAVVAGDEGGAHGCVDDLFVEAAFSAGFHAVHDGGDVAVVVFDVEFHVGVDGFAVTEFFVGEEAGFCFRVFGVGVFPPVGVLVHFPQADFFKAHFFAFESGEDGGVVAEYGGGLLEAGVPFGSIFCAE